MDGARNQKKPLKTSEKFFNIYKLIIKTINFYFPIILIF
jgi:hypothetical protein